MFYPTTKAMLDLANSLKALKAYQGLVSFPDLRPRGRPPRPSRRASRPSGARLGPLGSQAGGPLFDITVGLMLGDLSAVKRYPNSMAVLKFCHLGPRGARRAQGRGFARADWWPAIGCSIECNCRVMQNKGHMARYLSQSLRRYLTQGINLSHLVVRLSLNTGWIARIPPSRRLFAAKLSSA
jgi:hypothetical protein